MTTMLRYRKISPAPLETSFKTGLLAPHWRVEQGTKTIAELQWVFADEADRAQMDQTAMVYAVEYWKPVADGTDGGLFWGNSTVYPGVVGEEFFMTRGHFHAVRDRGEFYVTVSGEGMLVLMDEQRLGQVQAMKAGSTHYIAGRVAHRVVNTGDVPLTFLACWPSDAGHDYAAIDEQGFSLRVMRRNGRVEVIAQR